MISLSDITEATAGEEGYIWLQNGWYKNRPLFNFSLAACALPALYLPTRICSSLSLNVLPLPFALFLLLLIHISPLLPLHPSFCRLHLSLSVYLFFPLHKSFFSSFLLFMRPVPPVLLSFQFFTHFFTRSQVYIHYRLKRLDYLWPGCIPLHYFLLPSAALFTQTFTLTTPSCIPVVTPTHNLFFWLI